MEANWVSREWKVLEKIQGYYIQKVAHKDKKYVIQLELVSKELNHLAANLHVYAGSRHFLRPRILVKLATYKLSLSALTGQTKCKQTQLAGCKFD